MGRIVSVPERDVARQQALDGAPVEVCEDAGVHAKLPQYPQETEPLASFLDHCVHVKCPGEVLRDVHTEELEAADTFNLSITNVDWEVSSPLLSPVVHDHLFSFTDVEREFVVLELGGL